MARLAIKLQGEEITQLSLEEGMEYIAGRANDAQIVLPPQRGISRHHLKFYQREGTWICQSLSKFVLIQKGGESHEVLELNENCVFVVSPYEIHFFANAAEKAAPPETAAEAEADHSAAANPAANLPAFYNGAKHQGQASAAPGLPHEMPEDTSPRVNNEATMAGVSSLVPYLRISYPNTADDEVLKLEGHLWVAGRDPNSEIFVDSPHISRKHFEMSHTNEGFYITDLGSSNGTKINGQKIPPHEPKRLESGDVIKIQSIELVFEIRDTQFANRVESLPVPAFDPSGFAAPVAWQPQPNHLPMPYMSEEATQIRPMPAPVPGIKDWKKIRPHHLKGVDWKKHKVRIAIVLAIVFGVYMQFADTKKAEAPRNPAATDPNASVSFGKLTKEQQATVKDSFTLAQNLYVQGKYEICLTELAKLHELIPKYENSTEIQSYCEQGRDLVNRQRDIERKERERAMIEQQIKGYVETCKAKLKGGGTMEQTRICLSDAMQLDPEHHLIVEMINEAQQKETELKNLEEQRKSLAERVRKGENHFAKARNLYKQGQLAKALAEYERFIGTPYPQSENSKDNARRDVASIRKELKTKIDFLLDQCKTLGAKNRYKEAYISCDKAVAEDDSNETAKATRGRMLSELRREMKSIYEDSVLEESLGNVDSAKEKWKKIIKENLDFDEYTKKSKGKLLKYGIEM